MPVNRSAITRIRESIPLSKAELAERAGLSRLSIWKIESGQVIEPRPATIRKIADALGVPASELIVTQAA